MGYQVSQESVTFGNILRNTRSDKPKTRLDSETQEVYVKID